MFGVAGLLWSTVEHLNDTPMTIASAAVMRPAWGLANGLLLPSHGRGPA